MPSSRTTSVRGLSRALIEQLLAEGRTDEAMQCACLAVTHGTWTDPLQRPVHFYADLAGAPTYDPHLVPAVAYLESCYPAIRAEVDRVTDPRAAGFTAVEDSTLVQGGWEQVIFYDGGRRFAQAASMFPITAAIVDGLPESDRLAGWIMLSWLQPGAHIAPHCGYSNARLRIHLGIRTPPGARMRVRDEMLTWTEGECLVFDDSFEHEVWHLGTEPRVVLLVDVFHPQLPDAEKQKAIAARSGTLMHRLRAMMRACGVQRLSLAPDDRLTIQLDSTIKETFSQLMREQGIRAADAADETSGPTLESLTDQAP